MLRRDRLSGICLSLALMVLMHVSAHAQDLAAEMARVKTLLLESSSFHLETTIKVELKNDEEFPFNNMKTTIKTKERCYLYENSKIAILINEKWIVMALHDDKIILYAHNSSRDVEKARKKAMGKEFGIDLAVNEQVTYNGSTSGVSHYTIVNNKGPVERAEMYFSGNTGFLSKLVYYYAASNRLGIKSSITEISYFSASPTFDPSEFSESRFILVSEKSAVPAERYKNYQLILTDPEHLKNM